MDRDQAHIHLRTSFPPRHVPGVEVSEAQAQEDNRDKNSSPESASERNTHLSRSTISTSTATTAATSAMSEDGQHRHGGGPQIPTRIIEVTTNTATSSALPEALAFSLSLKGHLIAAYNSTHIWLIRANDLPRALIRPLELKKRPLAVEVLDDGSLLAVLASPHRVDLYRLMKANRTALEKVKSVLLGNETRTLALSPDGLVLATGWKHGLELVSLAAEASETDRRTLTCACMDSLAFSEDGKTLLATSSIRQFRETTVYSVAQPFDVAPISDEEPPPQEDVDKSWIRQILMPERLRNARHSSLLPESNGAVHLIFAFDSEADTFGLYDLAAKKFTGTKMQLPNECRWSRAESVQDSYPAVSPGTDFVAVATKETGISEIWLYELPDDWQYEAWSDGNTNRKPVTPRQIIQIYRDSEERSHGLSALRWLNLTDKKRLLAVSTVLNKSSPSDMYAPPTAVSSGHIIITDFECDIKATGPQACAKMMIDLDKVLPGEKLPSDDNADFEQEVEIVRRRTVAQRTASTGSQGRRSSRNMGRAATTANVPRIRGRNGSVDEDSDEDMGPYEEPYSQGAPRSQASLQRAATVAANSSAARRHLRALPNQPLEYRRADGLREIPHESDADNWVPPPPAYGALEGTVLQSGPAITSTSPRRLSHNTRLPPLTTNFNVANPNASSPAINSAVDGPRPPRPRVRRSSSATQDSHGSSWETSLPRLPSGSSGATSPPHSTLNAPQPHLHIPTPSSQPSPSLPPQSQNLGAYALTAAALQPRPQTQPPDRLPNQSQHHQRPSVPTRRPSQPYDQLQANLQYQQQRMRQAPATGTFQFPPPQPHELRPSPPQMQQLIPNHPNSFPQQSQGRIQQLAPNQANTFPRTTSAMDRRHSVMREQGTRNNSLAALGATLSRRAASAVELVRPGSPGIASDSQSPLGANGLPQQSGHRPTPSRLGTVQGVQGERPLTMADYGRRRSEGWDGAQEEKKRRKKKGVKCVVM